MRMCNLHKIQKNINECMGSFPRENHCEYFNFFPALLGLYKHIKDFANLGLHFTGLNHCFLFNNIMGIFS